MVCVCCVWVVDIQVGCAIQFVCHSKVVCGLVIEVVGWGLGVCCGCVLGGGVRVFVVM